MPKDEVIKLNAGWNGPVFSSIKPEDLSRLRKLTFGGGPILLSLGAFQLYTGDTTYGGFLAVLGAVFLFIGIFIEVVKNKKSLQGTSIDFDPKYEGKLRQLVQLFLDHEGYSYKEIEEDFKLVKGRGFELRPSGVRLTVFDVKAPISGRVARLGIRNIDENNIQKAIEVQVKLDNVFNKKGLRGKNPQNNETRYLWNGKTYRPMK